MEEMLERLSRSARPNRPVHTTASIDGVRLWDFDLPFPPETDCPSLPPKRFEVLFCQKGRMSVLWKNGGSLQLRAGEILLLSDLSRIQRFSWPDHRMAGLLVAVDTDQAVESLHRLRRLLGGPEPDTGEAGRLMARQRGCAVLARTPWSDGVFQVLQSLSPEQRGRYCALASAELFYLLCSNGNILSWKSPDAYYDRHQVERVRQVHAYLMEHLEETLTIEQLAGRYQISSTVLKQCFRRLYGQSIRKYIQVCRMNRAAELLRATQKPILQIANAVGYESTSQFGLLFKRYYQMPPSEYRAKMSESEVPRLNPHPHGTDSEYNKLIQQGIHKEEFL